MGSHYAGTTSEIVYETRKTPLICNFNGVLNVILTSSAQIPRSGSIPKQPSATDGKTTRHNYIVFFPVSFLKRKAIQLARLKSRKCPLIGKLAVFDQ